MSQNQTLQIITVDDLLRRVQELRGQNYRLVQIGATRLSDRLDLTYSFDLEYQLLSLRLHLPPTDARVPSISPIYWCAFLYENEIHDLFGLEVVGMAVDFHGKLYQTKVKFPFGTTKSPALAPNRPVAASAGKELGELGATPSVSASSRAPVATP